MQRLIANLPKEWRVYDCGLALGVVVEGDEDEWKTLRCSVSLCRCARNFKQAEVYMVMIVKHGIDVTDETVGNNITVYNNEPISRHFKA